MGQENSQLERMAMKLEIGGGKKPREGYLQMDVKKLPGIDVIGDVRKLPFKDGELDEIYGHWILEHFAYQEIPDILYEWKRALKKGGLLHLVTNNGEAHIKAFFEKVITIHELNRMLFGVELKKGSEPQHEHSGNWKIEDLHKIIWTHELVEYFFTGFSKLEITETWKHREDNGSLKCPGIIIKAIK